MKIEISNRMYSFYEDYLKDYLVQLNVPETYIIGALLSLILSILWMLLLFRKRRHLAKEESSDLNDEDKEQPRFRKRDKLYFYGKKMLRTVRGSIQASKSSEKSKRLYKILSKGILNRKNKEIPLVYRNEPPEFLLDFDSKQSDSKNHHLPTALINLLRSVKVFGYLDQKIILEMCKYMETRTVYAGNYLFKIGDPDDSIYVVESGKVHVFITDEKGNKHLIKECTEGSHVFSLLSVMDVLTGNLKPYKTVSAKAVEDTSILRLPGKAFVDVLQKFPESLVRITQIIMLRLQRVTFTALHGYLGLTSEIMRIENKDHKPRQHRSHRKHHHGGEQKLKHSSSDDAAKKQQQQEQNSDLSSSNENVHQYVSQRLTAVTVRQLINAYLLRQYNRQFSIPLPPVSLFQSAQDEDTHDSFPLMKQSHSVINEEDNNNIKNEERKRESSSNSNSSDEYLSNHSEFGESLNTNKLNEKLPEIRGNIAKVLKLEDPSILDDKIELVSISEGTILSREGTAVNRLFYIVSGVIYATQKELDGEESILFLAYPTEFCGSLSVVTSEPSQFTYTAKEDTDIAFITKENFYQVLAVQPSVVLPVAHMITKRMSPFVRQIDFALEWNLIESGVSLFRQDQIADNIYIVLNGRLRSILTSQNSTRQLVGEYGRGDLVGIVEILMETNNATTVMAIRDTEVAQIPSGLLNYIKYRHPRVVTRLIRLLSSKLLGNIQNTTASPYIDSSLKIRKPIDANPIVSNLCTIAILPVSDDVPLDAFTKELRNALNAISNTLLLTKSYITKNLGPAALERVNEYRLSAWLGQQEDHHRIVLYQCEKQLTAWTRRCMRQADCLLIVGLASNPPTVGTLEKEIENFAIRAQKELVLLHKMDGSRPKNTINWLNMRGWCTSHHHVRCSYSLFLNDHKAKISHKEAKMSNKNNDFSRLARFLTGTSVGLVLGGGGARGISHIGVMKALEEAQIPIDMIGGTSIGAFMGALYAELLDLEEVDKRAKSWAMKMNSYWRQAFDLTYPVTSMFSGSTFNQFIEEVFGDRQIEDLWLPYFNITTDISASKMRVHTSAPICDPYDGHLLVDGCYVNNLPGCLWRYIRASMSLSGYFAPICDPLDGHLLLDGGYVNNLPADVMHRMGINMVLAVDVGSRDDDNFTNYGDRLSGWWLLWKKWNPWATPIKVPDLTEIQSRLAYVSCQRQLEVVTASSYCEYLRPPIDKYRTIQFGSYDEIKACGYDYASMICSLWKRHDSSFQKYLERRNIETASSLNTHQYKDTVNERHRRASTKRGTIYPRNSLKFEDLSQFVNQNASASGSSVDLFNHSNNNSTKKNQKRINFEDIYSLSCGDEEGYDFDEDADNDYYASDTESKSFHSNSNNLLAEEPPAIVAPQSTQSISNEP